MQKVIYAGHIYILLIMSTGFMVHVLLHPTILTSSSRDSWISVIASIVPLILWTVLIYFLSKKFRQKNILSLLFSLNPWVSYAIRILFAFYFILTAFITFKYTASWAKSNYTFDIPSVMVIFPFSILCFYASKKGILAISSIAYFLLPIVCLFGFIVGIGNLQHKDYGMLFPIFQHGYKKFFLGILYTSASFFEIICFLFITPFLKNQIKLRNLLIVVIVIFLLTIGPLVGAIAEFGAEEAEKLKVPAYEQWKLLKLGIHITRLDFLSIFQWFSGAFIRITLSMFIANQLLERKQNNWILLILYVLLSIGVIIPWEFGSFFSFLYRFYFPASLMFFLLTFGLLFLLSLRKGDVQ